MDTDPIFLKILSINLFYVLLYVIYSLLRDNSTYFLDEEYALLERNGKVYLRKNEIQ